MGVVAHVLRCRDPLARMSHQGPRCRVPGGRPHRIEQTSEQFLATLLAWASGQMSSALW